MTHHKPCCASCAFDAPCEADCPEHETRSATPGPAVPGPGPSDAPTPREPMETLDEAASILSTPLGPKATPESLNADILREIRAPVFEGKPFSRQLDRGRVHVGRVNWPTPPRGFRPEIMTIRFTTGDGSGGFGPAVPLQLAWVPYGLSDREAGLTIDRGLIVDQSLVSYSMGGGGVTSLTASTVIVGGTALRVPYDPQSGKFDQLFWRVDLSGGVANDASLTIHDWWLPVHECFPPGVNRRPYQDTV